MFVSVPVAQADERGGHTLPKEPEPSVPISLLAS